MIITIRPQGASAAAEALSSVGIKKRIAQGIRKALQEGKRTGKSLTKARYTAGDINRFGKISMRASGLRGRLTISGSRNLIKRFSLSPSSRPPSNPPGGLKVEVVRGQGGYLPRAFVNRAGLVFERTGTRRFPIRHLSTVSITGAWSRVSAQVEAAIARHFEKEVAI